MGSDSNFVEKDTTVTNSDRSLMPSSGRDRIVIGSWVMCLGLLLLLVVAAVGWLFGDLCKLLLLRDIVSLTTALPAYGLLVIGFGLVVVGVFTLGKQPSASADKQRENGES